MNPLSKSIASLDIGSSYSPEHITNQISQQNDFSNFEVDNKILEHPSSTTENLGVEQQIKSGKLVFTGTLSEENNVIKPYGPKLFTKEERAEQLKKLAYIKTSDTMDKLPSGCSLLYFLFWDQFQEIHLMIRKETEFKKNPLFSEIVKSLMSKIHLMLQIATMGSSTAKLYHNQLSVVRKNINHIEQAQEKIAKNYNQIIDSCGELFYELPKTKNSQKNLQSNIDYKLKNSPGCRKLRDTFKLFVDVVTQEMHTLFFPLEKNPDVSCHFKRINHRAHVFLKYIESDFLFNAISNRGKKNISNEIEGARKLLTKFCQFFMIETKKLEDQNNYQALKSFWINLKRNTLANELSTYMEDFAARQPEVKDQVNFMCHQLNWIYNSMVEEAQLVLINQLLKLGSVTNDEMDNCVENMIIAIKSMQNYDVSSIEDDIKYLLKVDSYIHEVFSSTWNDQFNNVKNTNLFPRMIYDLEIRLKRCKKKPDDRIERILSFRNALNVVETYILEDMEFAYKILKDSQKKIDDLQSKKANSLYHKMLDLKELQLKTVIASLGSMKALIGRCFDELDSKIEALEVKTKIEVESKIINSEKAVKQLINDVEKEQNQKKAKKKKRKKGPVKVGVLNVEVKTDLGTQAEKPTPISDLKTDAKTESLNEITPPVVTPIKKVKAKLAFEEISNVKESLNNCKNLLNQFENSNVIGQADWQLNNVKNLEMLLENLIELSNETNFSADHIFEQINIIRRSVEALLGIATVFSHSSLEKVRGIGHHTGNLTVNLLTDLDIPIGIRFWAFKLRQVPLSLSDANRCVNYPAEAFVEQRKLQDQGKELIKYLIKVDLESLSEKPDVILRNQLNAIQENRFNKAVYFMEKILNAMCNPDDIVGLDQFTEDLKIASQPIDLTDETSKNVLDAEISTENVISLSDFIPQLVENREEAKLAIKNALAWITSICLITPIEGYVLTKQRTLKRNIGLKNCLNYLHRLLEKLGPSRHNKPMSTVLGQLELIRRLQKEVVVAALYHGNHFKDGEAIVDALDIRYENSPVFLMNVLRNVSTNPSKLPQVGRWLNHAHQSLSYPHKQDASDLTFPSNQLEKMIDEAHKKAIELNSFERDETIIVNKQKITPDIREKERKNLVETNEKRNIFPEIAYFLHILKHAFKVTTNAHLT
jgi:hypothetical protein